MAANFNPGIVYMTVSLILFAVAVLLHFYGLHLSLPISSATTILTMILPVAAFVNAFVYPNLLHISSTTGATGAAGAEAGAEEENDNPDKLWRRVVPVVFQGLQAIVTTVLATVFAGGFISSSTTLGCVLDAEWSSLYNARDAGSIRFVQDTLDCCGYAAVDDRAYPFAAVRSTTEAVTGICAEVYGRDKACREPWKAAMETHSVIAFGVVLTVGLMQILGLVLMRSGTRWWTALRAPEGEADDETDERSRLLRTERRPSQTAPSVPVIGPSTYAEVATQ